MAEALNSLYKRELIDLHGPRAILPTDLCCATATTAR
jgi:hypothetical protein